MRLFCLFQAFLWSGLAVQEAVQESPAAVPPAVAETLSKSFPGAKPSKVRVRDFYGLRLYEAAVGEAETTVAGDGTLVAIETPAGTPPPAVTEGAHKADKEARIEEARKVDTRARPAFSRLRRPIEIYALTISKDGRQGALQVGGDGTVLRPLEWSKAGGGKREPGPAKTEGGDQALPAAALEAIRKAFPEPAVNEVESQSVLQTVVYDVEVISRLGERQVHVTHDGMLLAVDQDAPASALPKAVLDSAIRAAGGMDACMARKREVLVSASLARLDAPEVSYRLEVRHAGGRARMDFGLDGTPLRPPLPLSPGAAREE